jgi:hypothetical protein
MTTRVKRKRGRPPRDRQASADLPPVPDMPTSEDISPVAALAALDVAEKAATPDMPASDAIAPQPIATEPTPARERERAKVSSERSTLTGRKFSGMQRSELATALQISERNNDELREKVAAIVPASAGQKLAAMERMCATAISALFDLAALATNVDEVRLDRDEERELGELGAPAIEPYMREYAQHAPLIAFGAKLATVITTKVLTVKAEKAQQQRERDAGS